ncbi:hypothetical protein LSTR_LSTR008982 [Laodelphax striatellus]|uniref:Uncharacterized protein n=1 Tax=Laodelphax striatellus TaxID=195883 RepID=A0A482WXG4_LAOST|nr:hypothetical protein LSTR_LSTR008982 [Laodelphax striatellus]
MCVYSPSSVCWLIYSRDGGGKGIEESLYLTSERTSSCERRPPPPPPPFTASNDKWPSKTKRPESLATVLKLRST